MHVVSLKTQEDEGIYRSLHYKGVKLNIVNLFGTKRI